MIHIATVHWKTDKWIDIQLEYLKKCMLSDFKVYAFLNDVPGEHAHKFHYCSVEPIEEHAIKLNLLAERISWAGQSDDIIIFLDGDAFPISDQIVSFINSRLEFHKLMAIQRKESLGDIQPHPSFCATTIGFWNEIKGDWKMGYLWKDSSGMMVTDVGGNLLKIMNDLNINWYPLNRTNTTDLHPLWFGVYDDMIYHHGAGFRIPFDRIDRNVAIFIICRLTWFLKSIVAVLERKLIKSKKSTISKNQNLALCFYRKIMNDKFFFKELLKKDAERI